MVMDACHSRRLVRRRLARFALLILASALAFGLLAVAAWAAKPTIVTDGASPTGSTYAIVEGNGSPGGLATTVHADYALASESWCTSHGVEGTPHETGPKSLGSGNVEISEIHVELSALEPGSEYCAELAAENSEGAAHGGQVYLNTPVPPTVKSESASHITASDATLEATIDPVGSEETTYEFFLEAPSCASYGGGYCEASGGVPIFKGSLPAGSGTQTVSVDIASVWHGLTANTIYGYRLVATRGIASDSGELKTFATPSLPSIESVSLSHLTPTDATLEAQIDTEGLETTYQFKMWASPCGPKCELIEDVPLPSGMLLGSFVAQKVSLDLHSAGVALTPGGEYGYSVSATSSAGVVEGKWQTFTVPQETVVPLKGTTPIGGGSGSGSGSGSQTSGSSIFQSTNPIGGLHIDAVPTGKTTGKGHLEVKRSVEHKKREHHKSKASKSKHKRHKARKG
jgi:hypothetical protein